MGDEEAVEQIKTTDNLEGDDHEEDDEEEDLKPMSLGALKRNARELGISAEKIDDLDEEEDPKGAAIALILKTQADYEMDYEIYFGDERALISGRVGKIGDRMK